MFINNCINMSTHLYLDNCVLLSMNYRFLEKDIRLLGSKNRMHNGQVRLGGGGGGARLNPHSVFSPQTYINKFLKVMHLNFKIILMQGYSLKCTER